MAKDIMISFRTTAELNTSLKHLAHRGDMSLSAFINSVLQEYLEAQATADNPTLDRRRFPRQHATIPAIICARNGSRNLFHSSKITDLSLGGINLSVPRDDTSDAGLDKNLRLFEVIFALPRQEKPIALQCRTRHILCGRGGYQVGACIDNADQGSYLALRSYLV